MKLLQLSQEDGSWDALLNDWRSQCAVYNEDFDAYIGASFGVLDALIKAPEKDAGVFALPKGDSFPVICQANRTGIPGFPSPVLRIRFIHLSPDMDFGEVTLDTYGNTLVDLFVGVLALSIDTYPSQYIKFHFRSPADRQFFASIGASLDGKANLQAKMLGGWLTVTKS